MPGISTPARRRASTMYDQNARGRLSYSSRLTQAIGSCPAWAVAHEAMAMVLPAPGGPLTRVSGPCLPASIRLTIRGRETSHGGRVGVVILEARMVSPARGARFRVRLVATSLGLEVITLPLL